MKRCIIFISLLICLTLVSHTILFSIQSVMVKIATASNLIDNKEYQKALIIYEKIIQEPDSLDPHQRSRIFNNIGFCFYGIKDYINAVRYYEKALEIDDEYFICLNNISASMIKLKQYYQAIPYLKKAYTIDKKYIKVVFNLCIVYICLRNRENAEYYITKAFEIDEQYTVKRLKKNGVTEAQLNKIRRFIGK